VPPDRHSPSPLTAIAFGYLEALLRLSSREKLESEIARLTSLNDMLRLVTEEYMIEDFTEPTLDLMKKAVGWLDLPVEERVRLLCEDFNVQDVSGYVVYHFRVWRPLPSLFYHFQFPPAPHSRKHKVQPQPQTALPTTPAHTHPRHSSSQAPK